MKDKQIGVTITIRLDFMLFNDVYKVFQFLSTVCRADIAEKRSHIETIRRNTKRLELEIRVKQNSVIHNKDNCKRYDD